MSVSSRDLDDYARQFARLPFEPIQSGYRRRLVLEQIARLQPRRLLEVGCAEAPLFTDLQDIEVTVVEPIRPFVDNARRLAAGRPDCHVVEGRLEDVALATEGFDMIIVGCLLHEVEDAQALLASVRRLCSAGTTVHVNVPNARSLHRMLAVAMGLITRPEELSATQRTMQQHATYDPAALEAEIARAGFEVVDRGSLFIKPFTHAQMQRLVDDGFLTPAMLEGLDRLALDLPALGSEIWCNARRRHA